MDRLFFWKGRLAQYYPNWNLDNFDLWIMSKKRPRLWYTYIPLGLLYHLAWTLLIIQVGQSRATVGNKQKFPRLFFYQESQVMKEGMNERIEKVCEDISLAYYRLTYLNLQYHRVVRDLEMTRKEMKANHKELLLVRRLEASNTGSIPNEELMKRLEETARMLESGIRTVSHVLNHMKKHANTVNRLMDANDEVENCLNLLEH